MQRALLAAGATVVGLVALLNYKSTDPIRRSTLGPGGAGRPTPAAAPPSTSSGAAGGPSTGGAGTTSTAPTSPAPRRGRATYTGAVVPYTYGDIAVRITVSAGRITAVTVPRNDAVDPRSAFINAQAVPILTQEALAAQGMTFDAVSGATFTSDAFAQSFQSALSKAGR